MDEHVTYVDTCMLPIPYVDTTFGILWYKELQVSAVLVDPERPAEGVRDRRKRKLKREMDDLLDRLEDTP